MQTFRGRAVRWGPRVMLCERARVEVYVPHVPEPAYTRLLEMLERELTSTFGGCTILRGISGSYLCDRGVTARDTVTVIYADAPFPLEGNLDLLARYAEELRKTTAEKLNEEAILVVAQKVYHLTRDTQLPALDHRASGTRSSASPLREVRLKAAEARLRGCKSRWRSVLARLLLR